MTVILNWFKGLSIKPPETSPINSQTSLVPTGSLGIDVSHHNGTLNWEKIRAGGCIYAFLKATEGLDYEDPTFVTNAKAASANGVLCGAYHFFRASTDGALQAEHFLAKIRNANLALPPVLDWEVSNSQGAVVQIAEATRWLDTVEKALSVVPIIYTGPSFANSLKLPEKFARYPLWIAHYTNKPQPIIPSPWKSYAYWQFTDAGHLAGYPEKGFDMNKKG